MIPLLQFVQLQAAKSALQFLRHNKLLKGDQVGHLKIVKDFNLNSDIKIDPRGLDEDQL